MPIATPNNNGVVHAKDARTGIMFEGQKMYLVYKGNTSAYTRTTFKLLFTSESDSFEIMITASTMRTTADFQIVAYRIGGADLATINSKIKIYYIIVGSIPYIYIKNIYEKSQTRFLTKDPIEGLNTQLAKVEVEEIGLKPITINN